MGYLATSRPLRLKPALAAHRSKTESYGQRSIPQKRIRSSWRVVPTACDPQALARTVAAIEPMRPVAPRLTFAALLSSGEPGPKHRGANILGLSAAAASIAQAFERLRNPGMFSSKTPPEILEGLDQRFTRQCVPVCFQHGRSADAEIDFRTRRGRQMHSLWNLPVRQALATTVAGTAARLLPAAQAHRAVAGWLRHFVGMRRE